MKEEIISAAQNPSKLEELYRLKPTEFSQSFFEVYETIKLQPAGEFWLARLSYENQTAHSAAPVQGTGEKRFSLLFIIIAALTAGTLIKLPYFLGLNTEHYITGNFAFFLLPSLAIYYLIKNKTAVKEIAIFSIVVLASVLFMNLVPWQDKSDTRMLSSLHLAFCMWAMLGLAFTGFNLSSTEKQIEFLKRNGEVFILTGIVGICIMILLGLTGGLFRAIKVDINVLLFEYVNVYMLVSAPLVANYMVENSPTIINKVAPFISRIFTPLILLAMTGFLVAFIFFSTDPFNNREELIVFNVLLAVNMAVIVFSFIGQKPGPRSLNNKFLLALSFEALVVNSIALAAIIYRLYTFGVTPNKAAVLGANVLMFINLAVITYRLVKYIRAGNTEAGSTESSIEGLFKSMVFMLPYYAVWAAIAAFAFPFAFGFK